MGPVVAGVIAIVALILGYLSFKTWRIAQVIFAVFIVFGAATNFYLAAYTLKVHDVWRKLAAEREAELKKLLKENTELVSGVKAEGTELKKGITEIKREIYKARRHRGGLYDNVNVAKTADPMTGAVTVETEAEGHGLAPKEVVFIFDKSAIGDGGKYVGEFKVTAVAEMSKTVELAPNLPLGQQELAALANNRGPWMIYLRMPIDDPEFIATTPDASKQALAAQVSEGFYDPKRTDLYDYEYLFHQFQLQRPLLEEKIARLKADIARTDKAQMQAEGERTYRDQEKANLQADLTTYKNEVKVVADYETQLTQKLAAVRAEASKAFVAIHTLAAELTELQLRAADTINGRTPVAQAAARP